MSETNANPPTPALEQLELEADFLDRFAANAFLDRLAELVKRGRLDWGTFSITVKAELGAGLPEQDAGPLVAWCEELNRFGGPGVGVVKRPRHR